jgi:hypothetical protein
MSDYELEVHYGEDEPPVRIPMADCDADDAEAARQALRKRIEHAIDLEAPLVYSEATDDHPDAGIAIDPTRVTSIDLVESGVTETSL